MLFVELANCSAKVAATSKRNDKIALLADVLRGLAPGEVEPAVAFLVGDTPLGRFGVGWATISDVRPDPAREATLGVLDVAAVIERLAATSGQGSSGERRRILRDMLERATESEQRLGVRHRGWRTASGRARRRDGCRRRQRGRRRRP